MARFCGGIGYGETKEKEDFPGSYEDVITERTYYGDVVENGIRRIDGDKVNDDIAVTNSIRIVADEFANGNFSAIRYVRWMGTLWEVDSIEVQNPRLLLRLGGVYNGPTPAVP